MVEMIDHVSRILLYKLSLHLVNLVKNVYPSVASLSLSILEKTNKPPYIYSASIGLLCDKSPVTADFNCIK